MITLFKMLLTSVMISYHRYPDNGGTASRDVAAVGQDSWLKWNLLIDWQKEREAGRPVRLALLSSLHSWEETFPLLGSVGPISQRGDRCVHEWTNITTVGLAPCFFPPGRGFAKILFFNTTKGKLSLWPQAHVVGAVYSAPVGKRAPDTRRCRLDPMSYSSPAGLF